MMVGIRELSSPNWQPIETAPRDGAKILAFAHRYRAYYGVAQWAEANEALGSVAGWFWPYAIRPTHWMPLPPPPVGSGQNLADAHSKNPPEAEYG